MMLLQDVARIEEGIMPGEYDRYNMRRVVSMTANIEGEDLGRTANRIDAALKAAGEPPRGVTVDVRGQVVPLRQMFAKGADALLQELKESKLRGRGGNCRHSTEGCNKGLVDLLSVVRLPCV